MRQTAIRRPVRDRPRRRIVRRPERNPRERKPPRNTRANRRPERVRSFGRISLSGRSSSPEAAIVRRSRREERDGEAPSGDDRSHDPTNLRARSDARRSRVSASRMIQTMSASLKYVFRRSRVVRGFIMDFLGTFLGSCRGRNFVYDGIGR